MSSMRWGKKDMDGLAAAASRGDAAAIDRWYRADYAAVFRIALGFLAHPADAEDVAGDAMVKILDELARWDTRRPYAVWRSAIVCNLCRDRLRRRATRERAESQAIQGTLPARLPRPEEGVEQGELRALIAAALAALPEREREVFVLRDLEAVDTADCAAALGIGESSVRSLLSLARRRLRDLLAPRLAGAGEKGERA
jgi:RNA polymerase sigma factor (sigma-70 family)